MISAVIFGGSGYIGSHLLKLLQQNQTFDHYYVLDIESPKFCLEEHQKSNVTFILQDVRQAIDFALDDYDTQNSWIFNFAAIHREPGHEYKEYFDTNLPGAENVCAFAELADIKNIFFTSSIAPYGKSLEQRTESSELYPETAYGISKFLAEKIHETWLAKNKSRRLIIVRPSVIFGPKDPGNVYRMIKSLKKGTFVLPDGGNVVKGYGYVYGLVDSMLFCMNQDDPHIIYNYAENPLVNLSEMVQIAKNELSITKPTLKIPVALLVILASVIQIVFKILGKKSDIHPVRVRKAGFPTNIKPQYLKDHDFDFKYPFEKALRHWQKVSPQDFE